MKERNWTTGPWEAIFDSEEMPMGDWGVISNHYDPIGETVWVAHTYHGLSRERADAHLIAAAPDLYEALAELLRVDDEWHGSVNSEMADARNKARTALTKARGES